jgi:hypothetical protein
MREEERVVFYAPDWIDQVISFDFNDWKIVSELNDHNNQSTAYIYEHDPTFTEAWGVFECVNNANPKKSAFMKFYTQFVGLPYSFPF